MLSETLTGASVAILAILALRNSFFAQCQKHLKMALLA
jgi:hypothetical protein